MVIAESGRPSPKVPGYVLYWVGKYVVVPAHEGPTNGRVTTASRKRGPDGPAVYIHVALDSGKLWMGLAREAHVLADRPSQHGELDEVKVVTS